jgi:predicted enzyme related to lactoylglutathione lyase
MPRVVHFEIPADDPKRAVEFYSSVFGWQISQWGGPGDYWLAGTGDRGEPGIDGAIMARQSGGTVTNTIGVPDLDESMRKVVAGGGSVIQGKSTVPGIGYMAYCRDTEGNAFGIMQFDPAAGA